jgi:membrane protein required for colicin V production
MTAPDLAVAIVLALFALLGFVRGIVRAVVGLVSWLAAIVVALELATPVAAMLQAFGGAATARYWIAFLLVLVAMLVAGAVIGAALSRLVRAIGLGLVDRLLGAVFGLTCGALFVLVFAFVAGLTGMAKRDWWQNSIFGPALAAAVVTLVPWLPPAWAGRLEFPGVPPPAKPSGESA